ncbi:hypothetical protein TeGR_g11016 [Tetraparma gracilis]|uniref:Uncharacterized protein n=1 Tax=Tetraparma gracilis TaxID=2962635 RepID=A0ABQ6MTF6_9STRA|nr:hypothetical protein TeGR_g11016 [Tetraparma gracilis]
MLAQEFRAAVESNSSSLLVSILADELNDAIQSVKALDSSYKKVLSRVLEFSVAKSNHALAKTVEERLQDMEKFSRHMADMDPREYLDLKYSDFFEGGRAPVRSRPSGAPQAAPRDGKRRVVAVKNDTFGSIFTDTKSPPPPSNPPPVF